MTDLARCMVELEALRDAMAVLAASRLADTAAWVHTSWLLAQAEGALRRATARARMSPPLVEELAGAIRSASTALHDLESLGQVAARWPAGRGDR